MIITAERVGKALVKRYELTKKEVELLTFIKQNERIVFQKLIYGYKNPMDETNTYSFEEYKDLLQNEFVIEDPHQWRTYILTSSGEQFVSNPHDRS